MPSGASVERISYTSAYDSASGAAVCASVIAVTANAWQLLLPVVGLGALPWIVHFIGSGIRRPTLWFIWTSGAAVSIHGLLGVTGDARLMLVLAIGMGVLPWIAHFVGSRLAPKSLLLIGAASSTAFIYVLLAVRVPTFLTAAHAFQPLPTGLVVGDRRAALGAGHRRRGRRGRPGWSMTSLGLVVGTLGMTAYLVLATGSGWELMLYYPVKAMWTAMVVFIPLASAGATALVIGVWRVARGRAADVSMALRAAWSSSSASLVWELPAACPPSLPTWV